MNNPTLLDADDHLGHARNDASHVRALLELCAGCGERALITCATASVASLLGDRGSCVLLSGPPRMVVATHAPSVHDWPLDLALYPEITLAIARCAVVLVEDVRQDARLERVRALLPQKLGAVAVVPLLLDGRCMGVLLAQSTAARAFEPAAVATASLIAGILAHRLHAERLLGAAPAAFSARADAGRMPGGVDSAIGERAQAPSLEHPAHAGASPVARRVMLVDDDRDHCALVSALLSRAGYRVQAINDGETAIREARATPPDAIILDIRMPMLDGFATAGRLKEDPATTEIPILFVSGCDDLMVRVQGLRLGAVDFLVKPFFAPELLARVERALEQVDTRAKLKDQANTDELTGLGNLRFYRERLALEMSRVGRYGTPLVMVMLDVDGLKRTNDRYGHAAGSRVLVAVGRVLREESRDTDVAVRCGGDEFVVLLPHVALAEGIRFAERTRRHIHRVGSDGQAISVSMGVSSAGDLVGVTSTAELERRADVAAYRAKRKGGGQVAAWALDLDG